MLQHLDEMIEDEPLYGTLPQVYKRSMRDARATVVVQRGGLMLDKEKFAVWCDDIDEIVSNTENAIRKRCSLPDAFNFNSTYHKQYWLYNKEIKKYNKNVLQAKMDMYDKPALQYTYSCPVCGRERVKKIYPSMEKPEKKLKFDCPGCKEVMIEEELNKYRADGEGETLLKERTKNLKKVKTFRMFDLTDKTPKEVAGKKKLSPKKDKDGNEKFTGDYEKLLEDYEMANLSVLPSVKDFEPTKTDKGGFKIDKDAIQRFEEFAEKRLEKIRGFTKRRKSHDKEEQDLEYLLKVLEHLQVFNKYSTLQKNFTNKLLARVRKDGRIYPSLLITGTDTGRLSCKSPNLQQIPSGKIGKKIRGCFKAPEGKELMSIDWSNLEVWIGAYTTRDVALQKVLGKGTNFHDYNTTVFFDLEPPPKWMTDLMDEYGERQKEGLPEPDRTEEEQALFDEAKEVTAEWDMLRNKVAKTIVFGRIQYGGSDEGIYKKVMAKAPNCGLTLEKFKGLIKKYMAEHEDYVEWCKEVRERIQEKRITINPFGRVRTVMSEENKIGRQALNSPVQGAAADFARHCMCDFVDEIKARGWEDKVKVLLQIHDEFLLEYPIEMRDEVAHMAQEIMCQDVTIEGKTFNLKIDIEVGPFWGGMGKYNIKTGKVTWASKHT